MGFMHINNLYRDQRVLMFKRVYAMEKIHGTSAHLTYHGLDGTLTFFSGGEKYDNFVKLFDAEALRIKLSEYGFDDITVYGEAYGGKMNGQSWRYGKELRFVVFDVQIGEHFIAVPQAEDVCKKLGLEFVHYVECDTEIETLNRERDADSVQAERNGVKDAEGRPITREGIVIRPLIELRANNSERIIAKHKRDDERETNSIRMVKDPPHSQKLVEAQAIAEEFMTMTRLEHVLDKLKIDGADVDISRMPEVMSACIADVLREAVGEIEESREARSAIGGKAAKLFRQSLQKALQEKAA
jgi:hypothetical protein